MIEWTDVILDTHSTEYTSYIKYDDNRKCTDVQFDDNKMSHKYILAII